MQSIAHIRDSLANGTRESIFDVISWFPSTVREADPVGFAYVCEHLGIPNSTDFEWRYLCVKKVRTMDRIFKRRQATGRPAMINHYSGISRMQEIVESMPPRLLLWMALEWRSFAVARWMYSTDNEYVKLSPPRVLMESIDAYLRQICDWVASGTSLNVIRSEVQSGSIRDLLARVGFHLGAGWQRNIGLSIDGLLYAAGEDVDPLRRYQCWPWDTIFDVIYLPTHSRALFTRGWQPGPGRYHVEEIEIRRWHIEFFYKATSHYAETGQYLLVEDALSHYFNNGQNPEEIELWLSR